MKTNNKAKESNNLKEFLLALYRTTKVTNAKTGKISFELDEAKGYKFEILCKRLK